MIQGRSAPRRCLIAMCNFSSLFASQLTEFGPRPCESLNLMNAYFSDSSCEILLAWQVAAGQHMQDLDEIRLSFFNSVAAVVALADGTLTRTTMRRASLQVYKERMPSNPICISIGLRAQRMLANVGNAKTNEVNAREALL